MQESTKSFMIKDLLRDLVHNADSSSPGRLSFYNQQFVQLLEIQKNKSDTLIVCYGIVFHRIKCLIISVCVKIQ